MSRPKKVLLPDAILVMDFGGLSTRVFYRKSSEILARSFVMESQVGAISLDTANAFTKPNLTSAAPENIAWVAIAEDCRAVGYLAASEFNAHMGLTGLKYSSALYKALAALWVASSWIWAISSALRSQFSYLQGSSITLNSFLSC
jgi:hypothetical protein